jgi:hypothetical protein
VNVILGGGDVGKTTILEAIALLLSPVNPTTLSDPDYHDRDIEAGFSIEAVLSLPVGAGMSSQMKPSWPWEWSGEEAAVPALEHDGKLAANQSTVFVFVAPKTSNSPMRSSSLTALRIAFPSPCDARSASSA